MKTQTEIKARLEEHKNNFYRILGKGQPYNEERLQAKISECEWFLSVYEPESETLDDKESIEHYNPWQLSTLNPRP